MSTEVVKMLTSIRSRTLKALPMTPQTSFARVPFSFRREKKPGLYKNVGQNLYKMEETQGDVHAQELA